MRYYRFVALLLLVAFAPVLAMAQESRVDVHEEGRVKSVVFVIGAKEYFVDGQTPGTAMDAAPFLQNGRTFVPIRYLAYGLGVTGENIGWNAAKKQVSLRKDATQAQLTVASKTLLVNGVSRLMDVSPTLNTKEGRTYLPARWVAEALGYQVEWDPQDSLVICWPQGEQKPDLAAIKDYIRPAENPAIPTGSLEEIFSKAKPLEGQPFSFTGWNFDPDWQEWFKDYPQIVIQEVTVADLKPHGIKLGGDTAEKVLHDLKVTKDGVTMTVTSPARMAPIFYLVEEGNVVRYRGGNGCLGRETGTSTCNINYILGGEYRPGSNPPFILADLTKVTHILVKYGNELLNVQNPIYQGGK